MAQHGSRLLISDQLKQSVATAVGDGAKPRFTSNVAALVGLAKPEELLGPEQRQIFERETKKQGGDRVAALVKVLEAGCHAVGREQARDRDGVDLESLDDFELETLTVHEVRRTNGVVEERIKRTISRLIAWNDQQPDNTTRIRITPTTVWAIRRRLSEDYPVVKELQKARIIAWLNGPDSPDIDHMNDELWDLTERHNARLGKGQALRLGLQAFAGLTQALSAAPGGDPE